MGGMVDVGGKQPTGRQAIAAAVLRMRPETAALLAEGGLPKGDALGPARVAGVLAAKRTPELIPFCHPVALTAVAVEIAVDPEAGTATVTATASAADRTGVEMEALVAASVAALTIYDMVKGVEAGVVIGEVALVEKTGGSSGVWRREP
jgi:cyclic pyranopterin monophosphate synthase